jgi:hypothetical protein
MVGGNDAAAVTAALEAVEPYLRRSLADPDYSAAYFRRHLSHLTRVVQASCLLTEAVTGADAQKSSVAAVFVRHHLAPDHHPEDELGWQQRLETIIGDDFG